MGNPGGSLKFRFVEGCTLGLIERFSLYQGLGLEYCRFGIYCSGFEAQGLYGLRIKIFRVSGYRAYGLGFRVYGLRVVCVCVCVLKTEAGDGLLGCGWKVFKGHSKYM